MLKLRSVTAGLLATAMLATSVTPAVAQGYGDYGYGRPGYNQNYNRYRHHRRHQDNSGAVVAGVIGVGILAAIIASAASKKNQQQRQYGYQNGYGQNGYPQNGYATGAGNIRTDDAAADACATAAERQFGGEARVRSIDGVDRVSDGFNVRGTVASGYGARDGGREGDSRSFSCSVRYGDVQRIDFGGYGYRN